ncbi:hypothetical protein L3Q82_011347 [Scortum barcoo]|uniref:Uncharacterized protein n=1 Tax=Scortum barcoo TaxID=214431 RepID=A0ACB8WA04_9TELE|nr:hypothetical protein L3Q82_011347 [Scortum barcoo]
MVIKKVTVEDVGRYFCQQYKSDQKQGEDSQVHLSVINMNEQKDDDKVTLSCSVSSYDQCRHTVKWLYEGKDVDKDNKDLQDITAWLLHHCVFSDFSSHLHIEVELIYM